jgi:hypothetical protein
MWVVHHKDTVLFFGLCFIVAFGHVSDCFAKACLPCLSYFRVGVSCKLFVLGDSFSHLRMYHSRTKVFDVDIVEVVLRVGMGGYQDNVGETRFWSSIARLAL